MFIKRVLNNLNKKFLVEKLLDKVHPDLLPLIWIGDGKYKNFSAEKETIYCKNKIVNIQIHSWGIAYMGEPSLLLTSLPIARRADPQNHKGPSYWPTYSRLNPKQRRNYFHFLENPYDSNNHIGYVFIFYYGLERHISQGNFSNAFEVLLKLHEVYSNHSFQSYSTNMLIFYAILHERRDIISQFIKTSSFAQNSGLSFEKILLIKYTFDEMLTAKEIFRFSSDFGFKNRYYIKGQPDLFLQVLSEQMEERYGSTEIRLKQLIPIKDLNKLETLKSKLHANSCLGTTVLYPNILHHRKLKHNIFVLLQDTHDEVKRRLAQMRTNVTLIKPQFIQPQKKAIDLDKNTEHKLPAGLKKPANYTDEFENQRSKRSAKLSKKAKNETKRSSHSRLEIEDILPWSFD